MYPAAAGPDDETETFGLDRAALRALLALKKGAVDDDGEVFSSKRAKTHVRIASQSSGGSDPNATMTIALSVVQAAGGPSLAFSEIPDLSVQPVDDEELELFTDVAVPAPPQKKK